MENYYNLKGFEDLYFEDSFLLNIEKSKTRLSFIVEIVLLENYHLYQAPKAGEQHCYKQGKIVFEDFKSVSWISENFETTINIDGSEDMGNIDVFNFSSGKYHLEGSWWEVEIESPLPKLSWL